MIDYNSTVKTEDVGSHSPGESDPSDEEEKDVDSIKAEKASKYKEIAEADSEESSDPDSEKDIREELKHSEKGKAEPHKIEEKHENVSNKHEDDNKGKHEQKALDQGKNEERPNQPSTSTKAELPKMEATITKEAELLPAVPL